MPDVLLRSEESDGVVSIVDNTVPANWPGPFLHKHDFDEAFYVLEGELTFQVEDVVIKKRAGELAFAPRAGSRTRSPTTATRPRATCSCARGPASSATSRA